MWCGLWGRRWWRCRRLPRVPCCCAPSQGTTPARRWMAWRTACGCTCRPWPWAPRRGKPLSTISTITDTTGDLPSPVIVGRGLSTILHTRVADSGVIDLMSLQEPLISCSDLSRCSPACCRFESAERLISSASSQGTWVLLRNIHLCPAWLEVSHINTHSPSGRVDA